MSRSLTFAAWVLLVGSVGLMGCGDRKGDLGAVHTDASTVAYPEETAAPAEVAAASSSDTGAVAPVEAQPSAVAMQAEPASPSAAPAGETVALPAETSSKPVDVTAPVGETAAQPGTEAAAVETAGQPATEVALAPAAPVGAPVAGPEDEKTPEPAPEPTPAPAPGQETLEDRATRLLEDAKKTRTLDQQAELVQADKLIEAGKKLFDDLYYEKSLEYFEKAVALDPTNRKAQELLAQNRALLGFHKDRLGQKLRDLENVERVKIQASLVALANAFEEARKYEEKGSQIPLELEGSDEEDILATQLEQLRQAQDRYRRVKEIVNWMPPPVDLPEMRRQVDEALLRVRQKLADKDDEISFLRRKRALELAEQTRMRETELFKARIQKLMDQVGDLYTKGEYTAAERLAGRILQLDPFNSDAEGWRRKARASHLRVDAEDIGIQAKEHHMRSWEDVEAANIPYGDLLTYPPNWDEIARRPDRMAIGKTKVDEQWKQDIKKKLQRKVSFEFVDTPLDEAITFLRSLTNVTMIVDPKVLEGGAAPINLRVTDMTLELALEWILRLAELDYALKDNAVFISKRTSLVEDVELRIYDVSDLTQTVPDFPGPDFQLVTVGDDPSGGGGGGPINPFMAPTATAALTPQTIADMIRNRVQPDSWDPNQGTSIEERAGKLVVMQRPEIHALVNHLLSNFRTTARLMVNIESRFLSIREAYLEDIGVEFQGLDPNVLFGDFGDVSRVLSPTPGDPLAVQPRLPGNGDGTPVNVPFPGFTNGPDSLYSGSFSQVGAILNHTLNFFSNDPTTISGRDGANRIRQGGLSAQLTILNNAQVQAFIRALGVRENSTTLVAPRLTVFNTQRAHMFLARQQSYIADYEISGDSYDPIIRQFLVGVVLDVRPTVSSDRRYVTLELRPTVTELANFQTRQIDSFTVQQGGNVIIPILLSFPVQFPELSIQRVRTTATVPDGGILLIGGLYRNIKFNAENGVPFLSDLPVVGRLFRWNVVDNAKTNLAILVSPRIILFSEEEAKL
ncbi:MAG: hypothetical protein HS116_02960 [Planctomycetes bacterium]|nr:hypothetical protein [Planctomycetota bacterium]